MVLNRQTGNQAPGYLLGICIIALCIYIFYILVSMRNSPELFLVPITMDPKKYSCTTHETERFTACVPADIDCKPRNGRLEIYSAKDQVRGSLEILDRLPQEKAWRASLRNHFVKGFLGDVDHMGTYELMTAILRHRYNVILMGTKATLIPLWMKHARDARIIALSGDKGLVFHTSMQSLGLMFRQRAIFMLSIKGNVPAESVVSLLHSIRLISPAEQQTGLKRSS
jgi:hypothetical protein